MPTMQLFFLAPPYLSHGSSRAPLSCPCGNQSCVQLDLSWRLLLRPLKRLTVNFSLGGLAWAPVYPDASPLLETVVLLPLDLWSSIHLFSRVRARPRSFVIDVSSKILGSLLLVFPIPDLLFILFKTAVLLLDHSTQDYALHILGWTFPYSS